MWGALTAPSRGSLPRAKVSAGVVLDKKMPVVSLGSLSNKPCPYGHLTNQEDIHAREASLALAAGI